MQSATMQQLFHVSQNVLAKAVSVSTRLVRKRPLIWPSWQTLPVSGLDVLIAQSVLYNLRRALGRQEGAAAIEAWVHALQLAQIASDRLLHAISMTQRNLRFWRQRLRAGSHGSFLLLSRGPGGFAADVMQRLGLGKHQHFSIAASDRIEERIAALQLLSAQLAEALAAVHRAADLLKLRGADMSAAATAVGAGQQQQALQQAVLASVLDCVASQVDTLETLLPSTSLLMQEDAAERQLSTSGFPPGCAGATVHQAGSKQQQQQSVNLQSVQQQISQLAQLLGVQTRELSHKHTSDAGSALAAASRLAAQLGPLVPVPRWAAMPSALQRHWIKYTLAAGVGVYAGAFLYRNSRLSGSTNLDNWLAAAQGAVKGAWGNHVVEPLLTVRDEMFRTFRDRPSIVSTAEFESDKASLLRMLADFQAEHPAAAAAVSALANESSTLGSSGNSAGGGGAAMEAGGLLDVDAVNRGMQVVMHCYEADLKKPIRGLLGGELARTLLIQVQRLKLDTESAMLELDQILRANELSISLVAAVPALLLSWTLLRGLWVLLLVRRPPDARTEALPCRLAMADLERALTALATLQVPEAAEAAVGQGAAGRRVQPPHGPAALLGGPSQQQPTVSAAEGLVLYQLFKVYREAQALYRLKDSSSRYSDWPHLSSDLVAMVQPDMPAAAKLELHKRMLRTYTVLQP